MSIRKILIAAAACLPVFLTSVQSYAQEMQEQEDSLVRLDYGESAELLEIDGQNIRKVIGEARFFHNNTYMLCDTAMWNIDTKVIDAIGNVSIIQDGTVLTSDRMVYRIDFNLAEFRGNMVQLEDRDHNMLRTRHLDYNTKDSVAVFAHGGSMRDKDGQIIESENGTYDAKIRTFNFRDDVNMFTDSIFVKTTALKYESDLSLATFGRGTDAWQEDNMLSADAGWYDRGKEIFFFRDNVHVMTDTQEGWSDSLYFYRNTMDVIMLGRAQVTDTTRNVSGLAGRIEYVDSLSKVTMTRKPAVISEVEDQGQRDTVYFGADSLVYYTVRKCDIDSLVVEASAQRLAYFDTDPVGNYRKKAAEESRTAYGASEECTGGGVREDEVHRRCAGRRPSAGARPYKAGGQAEPFPPVFEPLALHEIARPRDVRGRVHDLPRAVVGKRTSVKMDAVPRRNEVGRKIFGVAVARDDVEFAFVERLVHLFDEIGVQKVVRIEKQIPFHEVYAELFAYFIKTEPERPAFARVRGICILGARR